MFSRFKARLNEALNKLADFAIVRVRWPEPQRVFIV